MLVIPYLNYTITQHNIDVFIIFAVFLLINLIIELNLHSNTFLHLDKKSENLRQHQLQNFNPFYQHQNLDPAELKRKSNLVKKLKNIENNLKFEWINNQTIHDKISAKSASCSCGSPRPSSTSGSTSGSPSSSNTPAVIYNSDFQKPTSPQIFNFVKEKTHYHNKGKNVIVFTGNQNSQHKFWHYPGGGVTAEVGQWTIVRGIICTFRYEASSILDYKIEIMVETGHIDFLKSPDLGFLAGGNDILEKSTENSHKLLKFHIKKQLKATDGNQGYKEIILISNSIDLINKQLSYLVYRLPDNNKLQKFVKTDQILLSLNDDDLQEISIPMFIEVPKPPLLNMKSDVNSKLDQIVSLVFIYHQAHVSGEANSPENLENLKSFYENLENDLSKMSNSKNGKLPIFLVLPEISPQYTNQFVKDTFENFKIRYPNFYLFFSSLYPHKLGLSQVETEYVLYADFKHYGQVLNSPSLIVNGLKYLNLFSVDVISANPSIAQEYSKKSVLESKPTYSILKQQSYQGSCFTHNKLRPEFTTLNFKCQRTQYGNYEIYLGKSLEIRKIAMSTLSNHAIEFFNVARKLGERVVVCEEFDEIINSRSSHETPNPYDYSPSQLISRYKNMFQEYMQKGNIFCLEVWLYLKA